MKQIEKAMIIKKRRLASTDTKELQQKRQKFLEWLILRDNLKVLEMYSTNGDVIKSRPQVPQYMHEYKFCNTRKQIKSETCAETDKLEHDQSIEFICDIIKELIKKRIHFAVFYAQGQRSPHIRIYDFEQMEELKPHQRMKARGQFWRSIIPFRVHLLDQALWTDDHYICLEFSIHWKYGTPFELLFEWLPQEEKCKN